MANEVRNAGDDSAAPVVDKWLGLIGEHVTRHVAIPFVLIGPPDADL